MIPKLLEYNRFEILTLGLTSHGTAPYIYIKLSSICLRHRILKNAGPIEIKFDNSA